MLAGAFDVLRASDWWSHLRGFRGTVRRSLAFVALLVTGLWSAAASALDTLFAGLEDGWTVAAARFGRAAPGPLEVSLRPLAWLSRVAGRGAGAVGRLTGAHRRVAGRVDARLLRYAA